MLQGVLKRENPVRGELVQQFHADYSMTMFDHQLDYWSPQNRDARWPRLGVSRTSSAAATIPSSTRTSAAYRP